MREALPFHFSQYLLTRGLQLCSKLTLGANLNHVHDLDGHRMVLEDEFIDLVIDKLKNLWPECQMVPGSP